MNAPMNAPHTIPAADIVIRAPVGPARPRARHGLVLASFCAMVLAPVLISAWYLWTRAADQYASHVGFSVRTEEVGSAIELLGGVTELSGSSSSDADILYKFLHSQELVAAVDANLDLRSIWSQENLIKDPVFAYHPPGTIEDLLSHWKRMVAIAYDSGSGLIDLRVLAFTPEDAQAIAQDIFARSSAMINALSALAREDAIGYAQAELAQAEARLSAAQTELSAFRHRTQIVDPSIDAQGQMGLLTNLQAQLADALIELDLLRETTRADDARVVQGARRIAVIEARIAEERHKLGFGSRAGATGATGDWQGRVFADLVGEYEALILELEFARESYTAARAAFEAARNEARRQSRYLAAHVRPTRAERAEYPRRALLLAGIALLSGIGWAITVLVGYALRDRR
ncbi:MAG: capsule biosynthesis protein [Dinoroseobacter sp.]|nr:capsule biosynthesis protein [Dinoroseobacter sp.]